MRTFLSALRVVMRGLAALAVIGTAEYLLQTLRQVFPTVPGAHVPDRVNRHAVPPSQIGPANGSAFPAVNRANSAHVLLGQLGVAMRRAAFDAAMGVGACAVLLRRYVLKIVEGRVQAVAILVMNMLAWRSRAQKGCRNQHMHRWISATPFRGDRDARIPRVAHARFQHGFVSDTTTIADRMRAFKARHWAPCFRWIHGPYDIPRWANVFALVVLVLGWWMGWLGESSAILLIGNTFATPTNVMRRVARRLTNNAVFTGTVMRDYDDEYKLKGVKQGDTVTLRLPQRYEVTVGAVMNPTPLTDQTVTLSITDQTNIGFEYDSWAATLYVDDYMERYANPAVDQLVNNIDFTGLTRMYRATAKVVGTPGVVPTTNDVYGLAKTKLVEVAVPRPYNAVLTADAHTQIANANTVLFNPSAQITAFFRTGQFSGPALGIERWFEDENIASHLIGALGGTPLVVGAGQSGATINIDGATASVTNYWREGDVIQFASVEDANPLSRQSTARDKDFVVTANTNTAGGGTASVPISPSIVISGPFQNVDNGPGDNDAVTTFGSASAYAALTSRQGLVYHKEAYACVMADLVLPRGLWIAERINNAKLGVSIRMLKDHDIINDVSPARLDTAHGWGAIRQELACRVCLS